MTTIASVHRLRDKVAAHLGNGETVYMTQEQAVRFAEALAACARDISESSFQDSHFSTQEIAP